MIDFKNCTETDSFQTVVYLQGIVGSQVWHMILCCCKEIKHNGMEWSGMELNLERNMEWHMELNIEWNLEWNTEWNIEWNMEWNRME